MNQAPDPKEYIRIAGATKRYGNTVALEPMDLSVEQGECLTLLGPSGSGKTTLLKLIAGFETPTAGDIFVDGRNITALPPAERGIGMVFQQYALFPHMSVLDNVAYGLKMRGVRKAQRHKQARESLEMVRLHGFEARFPAQLSGGQQQRVALARALAFEPSLVLMDEPLGALDRSLRLQMEEEIRTIQRTSGVTMIYVTHDQEEALTLSDRIALLRDGQLVTLDDPRSLYEAPETAFTADFLGGCNLLDVPIEQVGDRRCVVTLGEERVELALAGPLPARPLLCFRSRAFRQADPSTSMIKLELEVRELLYLGEDVLVTGALNGAQEVSVHARVDPAWATRLTVGAQASFALPVGALRVVADDR